MAIDPYLPSRAAEWPIPAEISVAVVIPVYRELEETKRCLETVLVVDDCSPDPQIRSWLDDLTAQGEITLLRNESNRGFVASVNRGMQEAGRRDLILLNSDTECRPTGSNGLLATPTQAGGSGA